MEKISVLRNILDSGGDVVFVYNGQTYSINLVYIVKNKNAEFYAYSFNGIEYKDIDSMLDNAFINSISLRQIIHNATDIYED